MLIKVINDLKEKLKDSGLEFEEVTPELLWIKNFLTEEELDFAIKKEILLINAESEAEIRAINKIAKKNNKIVSVGIRINPNISAKTNKKTIVTGKQIGRAHV